MLLVTDNLSQDAAFLEIFVYSLNPTNQIFVTVIYVPYQVTQILTTKPYHRYFRDLLVAEVCRAITDLTLLDEKHNENIT